MTRMAVGMLASHPETENLSILCDTSSPSYRQEIIAGDSS